MSLEDVFNEEEEQPRDEQGRFAKGEAEEPKEEQAEPEPQPETPAGESEEPEEMPKEEPEEEEPEQPEPEKAQPKEEPSDAMSGLKAGIAAERRKRQQIEQELAALRAQQEQKQSPDMYEDPQGYQQHMQQSLQTKLVDERVNISHAIAKRDHEDYDEVMQHWAEMVQEEPMLLHQAYQQELPAEWAYQQVKRQLFFKEVQDPDSYKQRIEQEVREKLEAEIRQELESKYQKQQPSTPPPSLASAPGGGNKSQPEFSGPTPLKDLF